MSTDGTPATTPNALPPSGRRALPAASNAEARQQVAWQREMERAQMATWFKPPVATRPDSAAPQPGPAPSSPSRRHVSRAPGPGTTAPIGGASSNTAVSPVAWFSTDPQTVESRLFEGSMQAPAAPAYAFAEVRISTLSNTALEARVPMDAQIRRAGGPMQTSNEAVPNDAADVPPEDVAEPLSQASSSTEALAPLRLHEETMPAGQAVWIAMRADDDALAAMLPRIVADLQRDMQQVRGQRLHQVVCNGRLVWRDGAAVEAGSVTFNPGGERRPANVFDSIQPKGA